MVCRQLGFSQPCAIGHSTTGELRRSLTSDHGQQDPPPENTSAPTVLGNDDTGLPAGRSKTVARNRTWCAGVEGMESPGGQNKATKDMLNGKRETQCLSTIVRPPAETSRTRAGPTRRHSLIYTSGDGAQFPFILSAPVWYGSRWGKTARIPCCRCSKPHTTVALSTAVAKEVSLG